MIVVVLLLLLLLSLSLSYNIDYQIHSNNDLRELEALLIKGARAFKFDPHYVMDHPLCSSQPSSSSSSSSSCLLLNHDRPSLLSYNYNTTDDLLSFLSLSLYNIIPNNDKITIALCFKNAPDKCNNNSNNFQKWLLLVQSFYDKAIMLNNNIEFILDGDGKPIDCLIGKWPNWNSVWINTDSPLDAFYSNNITNDYNRFQVLNNPDNQSNWNNIMNVSINYGKFSSIDRPYQLWEPDSESVIHDYINMYNKGIPHNAGFHFAINIDIAMFRIYSNTVSSETSPAINQVIATSSSSSSVVAKISLARSDTIVTFYNTANDNIEYKVSIITNDDGMIESSSVMILPDVSCPGECFIVSSFFTSSSTSDDTSSSVFKTKLVLLLSDSTVIIGDMEIDRDNISVSVSNITKQVISRSDIYDMDIVQCTDSDSDICSYILSFDATSKSFILSIYKFKGGNSIEISSRSISCPHGSITGGNIVITNSIPTMLFYSSNNELYGSMVSKDQEEKAKWIKISVGKNFDIAYNNDVLIIVNDYGYCYNSHVHNTRSEPSVCTSTPSATSTVLDYSIGLTVDWIQLLESSSSSSLITSCNSKILHGSYNQGKRPSIVMTRFDNATRFFSVHEGLNEDDNDIGQCGDPRHHEKGSIIINSFDINNWILTLSNKK